MDTLLCWRHGGQDDPCSQLPGSAIDQTLHLWQGFLSEGQVDIATATNSPLEREREYMVYILHMIVIIIGTLYVAV